MGLAVEDDGAADDRSVATEAVLPDRVTQDDDRGGAALLVVRLERAAQCRLDPEDLEIVGRYQHAVQPRGLPAAGQRHAQSSRGRQRLERSAEPLPVQEIERADAVARRRRRRFEHTDDAFGLGIRERLQQHGIDQAEHGSVGANANRHHPDRDGGKAAIPQQQLQPVADVTQERVDPADGALIAMRFLHRFDAAEPAPGLAPGLLGRQARGQAVTLGHLEVGQHLALELALEPPRGHERLQSPDQPPAHGFTARNLATRAVARSQFATSTRSWRVPAAVSE